MAFNPDIADTGVVDFTSVSRGTGPNEVFSELFGGLNRSFENVTLVKDAETQRAIEEDVRQGFEATNDEFGFTPPAMEGELDKIQVLQNALEQGKISEVNYYGRLATLSKQLRTKYPRYESIVDSTIQSVTGTRPANAYREAILGEFRALASEQSDKEKARSQYETRFQGEISAIFGDDYWQNKSNYDFDDVQMRVARFEGVSKKIEAETKQLELLAKQGAANEKMASKVVSQDLSFIVETTMNRAVGANTAGFEQRMNEFIAGNTQDLDAFINDVSLVEQQTRTALRQRVQSKFVATGIITQDEANKAIEAALFPITEAKKAVVGNDFKLASKYATINKTLQDRNLYELMNSSPEVRAGMGLSELNAQYGAEFLNRHYAPIEAVALEVAGRVVGNIPDSLKTIIESGDQKVARSSLDRTIEALVHPKSGPDQISAVVQQMFGPQSIDLMSGEVVNPEDLEKMYTKLLDPRVTAAIKARGTPEDFKLYRDWAVSKIRALPSVRAAAGDVGDASGMFSSLKMNYNPATNRIEVESFGGFSMDSQRQTFRRVLGTMNKALSVLDPIAKADGEDTAVLLQDVVSDLVSLEKQPGKGFFSNLRDRLSGEAEPDVDTTTTNSIKIEGEDAPESEIDFMYESEEYDPLDEPEDGKTLSELVRSGNRRYSADISRLRPEISKGVSELQAEFGKELPILSGYRDPDRNRRAGGAKRSQHMHGNAVDIDTSGWSREDKLRFIQLARSRGFGGIGIYPNSIHIDKGSKRAWGPNYKNTSLPSWARSVV